MCVYIYIYIYIGRCPDMSPIIHNDAISCEFPVQQISNFQCQQSGGRVGKMTLDERGSRIPSYSYLAKYFL